MRAGTIFPAAIAISLAACSAQTGEGPDMDVILAETPAATLSAYGLFEDAKADTPNRQLIAYDLTNPLFTDYAAKQRYLFVPEGEAANYDATDVFAFPVGTVLVKTFSYSPDMRAPQTGAYKVETRLLIRKAAGWRALPYVWNEAQTEAVYTPIGAKRGIEIISPSGEALQFIYAVPNANQCKTCHQSGHDIKPIGPKARNLNHEGQLEAWAAQGKLAGLPGAVPSVPSAFDPAPQNRPLPILARIRAAMSAPRQCLHAQCRYQAHQEDNPTRMALARRQTLSFSHMNPRPPASTQTLLAFCAPPLPCPTGSESAPLAETNATRNRCAD